MLYLLTGSSFPLPDLHLTNYCILKRGVTLFPLVLGKDICRAVWWSNTPALNSLLRCKVYLAMFAWRHREVNLAQRNRVNTVLSQLMDTSADSYEQLIYVFTSLHSALSQMCLS